MDDGTRVIRRLRRVWPPTARTAAAIIATVGLALFVGATTTQAAGAAMNSQSPRSQMLAFAHCMRSHGVPNFPDPNTSGVLPKAQVAHLAATNLRFPAARRACAHLLPNGGQPTQTQVQQAWNDMRKFARCMRSHSVPNWPDPTFTSQQDHRPFFRTEEVGIDPNAPQLTAAIHTCQHFLHANNPLVTLQ
jgi:hypothetical protein